MSWSGGPLFVFAVIATLGSGLMSGLLFAFSNFVMKALCQQLPANGVRTMQAINICIINPFFLVVFLGTAVAASLLAIVAVRHLSTPGALHLLTGAALYLLGPIGITMMFNVPLNDRLASQLPDSPQAGEYWLTYLADWLRWNHVRAAASFLATVFFILALRQLSAVAE